MTNIEIGDYVKFSKWINGLPIFRYDEIFRVVDIVKDGNSGLVFGYYIDNHYAVLDRNYLTVDTDEMTKIRLSNIILYEKGNRLEKIKNIINRINDKQIRTDRVLYLNG